jgi:mono/diheme cytochrome c family protein
MGRIIFGLILGLILAPFALLAWFRFGQPPVAVADPPLPFEQWITGVPLKARIDREKPSVEPIQGDEGNFVAGAGIYRDQCAACHGLHGKPSSFGAHMYPSAPPLWQKHPDSEVVGVSDDPPGETFWKVANGIRLSGMPAFKGTLSETKIWQVSLLVANADKPLPPGALAIVRGEPVSAAPQNAPAPKH